MKRLLILTTFIAITNACSGSVTVPSNPNDLVIKNMTELHQLACNSNKNSEIWGKNSLYDCKRQKLYIPYQLWTGVKWNGKKSANCMHSANSTFNVDGDSLTTIKGPKDRYNHKSEITEKIWIRDKVDGSKSQYFTCHAKGIGRVYDSRRARNHATGRCKFPAGNGWEIAKRRKCDNTAIEITEMTFNKRGVLQSMKFKWWVGGYFDHMYLYIPNYGMSRAWQQ